MLKRFFIFLSAMIFAVILFELFLQFSPFSLGIAPVIYDKDIGRWHKKNFSARWIRECYNTEYFFNDKGLIKNNYEYKKNKKDIVILGDSYIEAKMVKNKNIIHNALYQIYNGKYNILNYGLAATSPTQQFVILQKKVNFQNTKEVIHFINMDKDIYECDKRTHNLSMRPAVFLEFTDLENYRVLAPKKEDTKERIRDFLSQFELYTLLARTKAYIEDIGVKEDTKQEKLIEKEDLSYNWLQIKGAIYQTKKLLKDRDIEYKIIIYGANERLKNKLMTFLTKKKIDFYDLYLLAKKYKLPLEGYPCDGHWNDKSHNNIAKIIKNENIIQRL